MSNIHTNRGNRSETNSLYDDLMELRDILPEAVPCELPKDKGTRHEIDLKPGSKYCVMK